jgi:hypothetical protein
MERYLALALVYLGVVAVVLPWYLPLNSSRLGKRSWAVGYIVLVSVVISARDPLLSGEW